MKMIKISFLLLFFSLTQVLCRQSSSRKVTGVQPPPRTLSKGGGNRYENVKNSPLEELHSNISPKNYAVRTILGQNIINCRSFSLETQKQFNFLGSYKSYKQIPIYPNPEIAFLGRSNVGKSSLLNCLTGLHKNIAVESKTPGRTQCINIFGCRDKQGEICNFVDLPGYGYAKISKEMQEDVAQFILEYLENRTSLRLAILLVDIRREPQESDQQTLQLLEEIGIPVVVVATKADKISNREESERALQTLQKGLQQPVLPFSSISGQGRKEIWKKIRDGIVGNNEDGEENEMDEVGQDPENEDEIDDILRR